MVRRREEEEGDGYREGKYEKLLPMRPKKFFRFALFRLSIFVLFVGFPKLFED